MLPSVRVKSSDNKDDGYRIIHRYGIVSGVPGSAAGSAAGSAEDWAAGWAAGLVAAGSAGETAVGSAAGSAEEVKMKVRAELACRGLYCPSTRRILGLPTLIFSPAAPPKQGGK